jgi:hypothetical protein
MNYTIFYKIINLWEIIFEPIDWDEEEFSKLEDFILECENHFQDEMSQNLFGKTSVEKEDILKIYFGNIAKIYYDILSVVFDDDEPKNIVINKIKESFQFIIDIICDYSLENDINLIKIVEDNKYYCVLNIGYYYNKLKELQIEKGTKLTRLKSEFLHTDGYYLFEYLIDNFDKKTSNDNKFSCIYRMMVHDGFLSPTLKPEEYKNILSSEHFKITLKFSINQKGNLSQKIINQYELIKSKYFDSLKI